MAAFIVKRREFIEHRRRAYGGYVACFTKWRTLGRFATLPEASARRRQETVGLFQAVVFFGGKQVINSDGYEVR
jgi:hypothetical protein